MEENLVGMQPEGERWDPLGAANDDVTEEHHDDAPGNKDLDECPCTHWYATRAFTRWFS